MADSLLLMHTAIAIGAIIVAITWLRIPPVFVLLAGTVYLGLAVGLGPQGTTEAITTGFGDLMAEVGLLITLGVLLGSLLTATNTLQRLTEALLRVLPGRSAPYAFAATLSSLFTSIYSDVLLVLTAPLARRIGARMGPGGLALMGGALTAGIEVGLVFVAPGVAAVAIAGLLHVPLGLMFVYGLVVALPTALLTMAAYAWLIRGPLKWDPARDELQNGAVESAPSDGAGEASDGEASDSHTSDSDASGDTKTAAVRIPSLPLCITPVLLTLALIALGAAVGRDKGVAGFLGDPVMAMFIGTLSAYVLARWSLPGPVVDSALSSALKTVGPILVLTGVSGSLATVIGESGLADVLGGYFSAGLLPPLLLVWLVAALLHVALGSISVAGITAAGILAPLAGSLGVEPVLIALAAGSGALFVPHVSSNFFWMFQNLLGLTTRGTFKAHSLSMTLASVISLPIVLLLSVFV